MTSPATCPRIKPFLAVVIAAAGLNLLSATGSLAQDFDCREARHATEKAICASSSLKSLDEQMARAYGRLWSVYGNENYAGIAFVRLRNEQRAFLENRDDCGSSGRCIRNSYETRIDELRRRIHEALTAKG